MRRKTVIGVEITQEAVRAVEVTEGSFPILVGFGEVPLPVGAATDSRVRDRDAVALALQHLWETAGLRSRDAILGVGGRRILVREISIPTGTSDDLRSVLPPHVQELLPVAMESAILDFSPLSQHDGETRGLLVAAPSDLIERMIASFARTRSRIRSVDLVPFGLARIARRLGNAGEATMMIHIGDHTTHIVVAVDGVPQLVRTIAAEMLTSAILRRESSHTFDSAPPVAVVRDRGGRAGLRIGAALLTGGAPGASERDDPVVDLAEQVRETMDLYRARPGTRRIGAVFVSGAGSGAPGVQATISAVLKRPLRIVGIDQLVSSRTALPRGELALDLVGTIGIVLGSGR